MIAPLCIIQARVASTRLPEKMLLPLGGHAVLWWAWDTACRFLPPGRVVIACPLADVRALRVAVPLADFYGHAGNDHDVLERFVACAHLYGASDIYRVTPDDIPIDLTREHCTLAQLDHWHATVTDPHVREHIGLLFPPRIEINTQADYEAALKRLEGMK